MIRKIAGILVFLILISNGKGNVVYASDRVVLTSIPSDIWSDRVYLIADKLSWMDYENFSVQIGDLGELVYDFPKWYHGKYEPHLYNVDLNNDTLSDIVVILNNDKAPVNKPRKDIHILNQILGPCLEYQEAPIESITHIIRKSIKINQKEKVVTIKTPLLNYQIDLGKFEFHNPHDPHINLDTLEYFIEDGNLIAELKVLVKVDDRFTGDIIGNMRVKYGWCDTGYGASEIEFISFTK